MVKLASGVSVQATLPENGDVAAGREVSVVVRPEHTDLTADADAAVLHGTLANIVYFGTDTHYHIDLAGGGEFTVRMQNTRGNEAAYAAGEPVHIHLDANALQVLRD